MESQYTAWRLAAAIAYHLPGAGILVHNDAGRDLLVAPTTTLLAAMHPGELRDILGLGEPTTAIDALHSALHLDDDAHLAPEVITLSPVLVDRGLGLYRIGNRELGGAYAFATTIDSDAAGAAIQEHAAYPEGSTDAIARAGLGYDELLDVTMAIFEWEAGTPDGTLIAIELAVRAAQSACGLAELIRELEHDPTLEG